jgi:hypothetical protein
VASYLYERISRGDLDYLAERLHTPQVMQFLTEHDGTMDIVRRLIDGLETADSEPYWANALVLLALQRGFADSR